MSHDIQLYELHTSILLKFRKGVMKKIRNYLLLLLLVNCHLCYSDEIKSAAIVEYLFLSSNEVDNHPDPEIQMYHQADPGYAKTFFYPKEFPVNKDIVFSIRRQLPKESPYKEMFGFFINEQGLLVSSIDKHPFLCVTARGFLPGERVFCRFATKENDFKNEFSFIPNPIQVKNKYGAVLVEAEIVNFFPAFYQCNFPGFKENEEIRTLSISGRERLKGKFKVSKKMTFITSPDVKGSDRGMSKLTFTRKTGEKIQVNLPWGREFIDYAEGNKIYKSN